MMYRLQGDNELRGRYYPYKVEASREDMKLRRNFRHSFQAVPTSPNWPHCQLMVPPEMPLAQLPSMTFSPIIAKEDHVDLLPDISPGPFTLVSGKCKEVIEKNDPWPHQFWPAEILLNGGGAQTRRQFFWMSIRRCVAIDEMGLANQPPADTRWSRTFAEDRFMPAIQSYPELKKCLEKLPFWQAYQFKTLPNGVRHVADTTAVIYLTEEMLQAFLDAGLKGVNLSNGKFQKDKDTVFHI